MKFTSPYGPSLLMKAVMDGSADTVKFLVETGADPNIFDEVCVCRSLLLGLFHTFMAEHYLFVDVICKLTKCIQVIITLVNVVPKIRIIDGAFCSMISNTQSLLLEVFFFYVQFKSSLLTQEGQNWGNVPLS